MQHLYDKGEGVVDGRAGPALNAFVYPDPNAWRMF